MNLTRYRRLLKALVAITALMLLLGVALLVALNWYFSTEGFKKNLTSAFQQATGYEIRLEGDLGVTLFPWLGFKADQVRLYEPGRPDPLVEAEKISAGVRLIPLISGHLDLDTVALEQVVVTVLRRADGTTGWDGLVRTFFPSGEETTVQGGMDFQTVTVRGVQIRQGSLVYLDEQSGQRWEVNGLDLRTGVYEPGTPLALSLGADISRPEDKIEGKVTVTGELAVNFDTGHLHMDQGLVDAELAWPQLLRSSDPVQVTARVSVDTAQALLDLDNLHAKGAGVSLSGAAKVRDLFSSPVVQGHLETGTISPRQMFNTFAPDFIPDSDPGIFRSGKAALDFDYDGQRLRLSGLDLAMDDSRATGSLEVGNDLRPMRFDLAVDQLDFDRYYRLFITPEDFYLLDFFPEFIRTWDTNGTISVGSATLAGAQADDMDLSVTSSGGDFQVVVERAWVRGGAFQGDYQAHVALDESGGYLLSMGGQAKLVGVEAQNLPLGSGQDYALTGSGDFSVVFSMSEQPYPPERVIDDVLRYSRVSADWVLRNGGVLTIAEGEGVDGRQVMALGDARMHLTLEGDGQGGEHDPFGWQAGLALRLDGVQKLWNLSGKLSGPLSVSFDLEDFSLKQAEAGFQYHGPELPQSDPVAVVSAVLDLDSATGQGGLSELSAEAVGLRLSGELHGRDLFAGQYSLDGRVQLASPDPKATAAAVYGEKSGPKDPEAFRVISGQADVLVGQDAIDLMNLRFTLDDTLLAGTMRLKDLGAGTMVFNLSGNGIDMDRYRQAVSKSEKKYDPCDPENLPPPQPLPLESLRALDLEGNLALDHLIRNGFRMEGVQLVLQAKDGHIALSPVKARFYGGTLDGGLTIFVGTQALEASADMEIHGFQAGDMLLDQFERDYVQGTSEVRFHLKTAGATNEDLLKQLSGTAGFVIRNGSYKFLGQHREEKQAQEELGAQMGTPEAMQKTASTRTSFDLALAEFEVAKGVFEVTQFKVNAPLLTGTGSGHFDVGRNIIDLAINADFVAAPDVPIFIEGCLSDPDVRVPGDEVLQNAVEDIITIPLRPLQYLRDQLF